MKCGIGINTQHKVNNLWPNIELERFKETDGTNRFWVNLSLISDMTDVVPFRSGRFLIWTTMSELGFISELGFKPIRYQKLIIRTEAHKYVILAYCKLLNAQQ